MKFRLACSLVLALAAGDGLASGFLDLRTVAAFEGNADAVRDRLDLCSACHGMDGASPVPLFPHLAGQSAEYQYWQLVEFKRHPRPESPMSAIIAAVDEQQMRDYSAYYAALPPIAPVPADGDVGRGAALYRDGDAALGIPPCQGCHGAGGEGHPLAADSPHYRTYPHLRGQHAAYVAQRLKDFRDGKLVDSSGDLIMRGVAQGMRDADIDAVAAWLQSADAQP